MRSLTLKLTLGFLMVGLTGSVLVAVFLRYRTRTAFDQFILTREQQLLVSDLLEYYQVYGSWEGLPRFFQPGNEKTPFFPAGRRDWSRFSLVGTDRKVIISAIPGQFGEMIPERMLDQALLLESNGKLIGWLVINPLPREWVQTSPEGLFLKNVNRATLLSALTAVGLALILGGFLAYTQTRSLRELTDATHQIAQGKLGMQVKVRSQDEIGKLSESFNKMSLDLERATQARRQMTADIAHDLRSPLSVISGYAEALSDGKLTGSPEIFEVLYQETHHLSRLIEDLRLLSLADAGELSLYLLPVNPRIILERTVSRHAVASQQKQITLKIDCPEDLPEVKVDMDRLAQVMDNLVINAFRYSSAGSEVVLGGRYGSGKVLLQVSDQGSGMEAEELPFIFDRFYRGDKARAQNGESGLGLAIARSIVEAHGGTITVESEPNQGATFTIVL